ncbi:hypothetical protein AMECASPLE_034300 [Ameca splendens]|uniref:Uncharacterized protein n=1 Tax=Ameca splendens TaxID=208324 RepID=A0ABV0XK06_9TELE
MCLWFLMKKSPIRRSDGFSYVLCCRQHTGFQHSAQCQHFNNAVSLLSAPAWYVPLSRHSYLSHMTNYPLPLDSLLTRNLSSVPWLTQAVCSTRLQTLQPASHFIFLSHPFYSTSGLQDRFPQE